MRLCDQPDDALMPALVKQAQSIALRGTTQGILKSAQRRQSVRLHPRFDQSTLAVDAIQSLGQCGGGRHIVRQQALDADRHILQPSGRIEARRHGESQV